MWMWIYSGQWSLEHGENRNRNTCPAKKIEEDEGALYTRSDAPTKLTIPINYIKYKLAVFCVWFVFVFVFDGHFSFLTKTISSKHRNNRPPA